MDENTQEAQEDIIETLKTSPEMETATKEPELPVEGEVSEVDKEPEDMVS